MPKAVHITAPPPTYEETVRRLRISKTRQKELMAWAEEAWKRVDAEEQNLADRAVENSEMTTNASAAD
jgi:hypothetical protein